MQQVMILRQKSFLRVFFVLFVENEQEYEKQKQNKMKSEAFFLMEYSSVDKIV